MCNAIDIFRCAFNLLLLLLPLLLYCLIHKPLFQSIEQCHNEKPMKKKQQKKNAT